MNGKRATSYDVAKLAGVSQSAVSRVFSPHGSASRKTREKVLKAARELGFAPNPIAMSLSMGRSRLAGLIVTQYAQQNYPIALKSAVDSMTETGDSLLIQIVDASDMGDEAVHQLLLKRADFILSAASLSKDATLACEAAGVPLVMINRMAECAGVDTVSSPNMEIMHDIARMLHGSGARAPVFLRGGMPNFVSEERSKGFTAACAELGLKKPRIVVGDFSYDGGRMAVRKLQPHVGGFDCIVAANDALAIGAMDVLRYEFGLKIPGDIQVVGHDDIEAGRFQSYQLTTVRQDMSAMLAKAIELAASRSSDFDRADEAIVVPNVLIERGSTRRAPPGSGG